MRDIQVAAQAIIEADDDWLQLRARHDPDIFRDVAAGYLAQAETVERLRVSLTVALAVVNASLTDCPINSNRTSATHCPKCGATDRQNCGPNVTALDGLATAVTVALADLQPKETR